MDTKIAELQQRYENLQAELSAYVRTAPMNIPSESLMPRVRYMAGQINELERTINFLRGTTYTD